MTMKAKEQERDTMFALREERRRHRAIKHLCIF